LLLNYAIVFISLGSREINLSELPEMFTMLISSKDGQEEKKQIEVKS
jgi:hypothetical protein